VTGLNLYSPLVAVVGAVVFLVAYHAIRCILYSDALRLLSRKVQTGKLLHPAEAVHLRIVAEEKKTKVPKETVPAARIVKACGKGTTSHCPGICCESGWFRCRRLAQEADAKPSTI